MWPWTASEDLSLSYLTWVLTFWSLSHSLTSLLPLSSHFLFGAPLLLYLLVHLLIHLLTCVLILVYFHLICLPSCSLTYALTYLLKRFEVKTESSLVLVRGFSSGGVRGEVRCVLVCPQSGPGGVPRYR